MFNILIGTILTLVLFYIVIRFILCNIVGIIAVLFGLVLLVSSCTVSEIMGDVDAPVTEDAPVTVENDPSYTYNDLDNDFKTAHDDLKNFNAYVGRVKDQYE